MITPFVKRLLKREQVVHHCSSFIFTGIKEIDEIPEVKFTKWFLTQRPRKSINAVVNNKIQFRKFKQDFYRRNFINAKLIGLPKRTFEYGTTVNDNFGKDILNDDCFR
jgi:hypothetical protein